MTVEPELPASPAGTPRPASRGGRFRLSFASHRQAGVSGPPLMRRWEATGLLLLVTVGAAFTPGGRGEAAATHLMEAASRGELHTRLLTLAPPLLALLFAWRAAGRLARPFAGFLPMALLLTLSGLSVYIAFQLGLYLALRTPFAALPGGQSPWRATLPGAALGGGVALAVATIRFLRGRAAAELRARRGAPGAGRTTRS